MPTLKTKDYKNFEIDGEAIPFSLLERCMPNDQVIKTGSNRWIPMKRSNYGPLIGILDVTNTTRYGFTAKNVPIYLFYPMNKAFPPFRVGSTTDPTQNVLAVITFESWELGFSMPRGLCQQILGPVGDYEAEAEALYWLHSPLTAYTKKQSKDIIQGEFDVEDRQDITDWLTFNVDPAGCLDIDDVFSYRMNVDGSTDCIITIADVADLLPEGSMIDQIAQKAGQSLYQEGRQPRHMLPKELAEDYGSLAPGAPRLGLSLFFTLTSQNTIVNLCFKETVVTNKQTYTYDSVSTSPHKFLLSTLCALFLPKADASDPHEWIAALMIFYNKEMAQRIKGWSAGIARAHGAPDQEKMNLLESINPNLDLKFLAMKSATYICAGSSETSHYGLEAEIYCHATSPLRRYADIQNQRVWKWITHENHTIQANDALLLSLNAASKAAKKHDRDFTFLTALQNLNPNPIIEGFLLDFKLKDDKAKLEVWIPAWNQSIKIKYGYREVTEGTEKEKKKIVIMSRDEKETIALQIGDKVKAAISFDSSKPYWKERMIFRILST
jgi:exoribonuclease R